MSAVLNPYFPSQRLQHAALPRRWLAKLKACLDNMERLMDKRRCQNLLLIAALLILLIGAVVPVYLMVRSGS